MMFAAGPVIAGAVLLMVTGAAKLRSPGGTAGALRSVGAPRLLSGSVRLLAVLELGVGAWVLAAGGTAADVLLAVTYGGFVVFLVVALRSGGQVASCGCAGRPDTPPTGAHVVMATTFAGFGACAAASGGVPGVLGLPWNQAGAETLAVVGFAVVTAWLARTILVELAMIRPLLRSRTGPR